MIKLNINVWVIAGLKVGQRNSSIGVAERINSNYTYIKVVDIEKAGSLEAYLQQNFGREIIFPDLVISTGKEESSHYAIALKKLSKGVTSALNINYPPLHLGLEFDIVAAETSAEFKLVRNPIYIIGVPHKVTSDKIKAAREELGYVLEPMIEQEKPIFLALIGGDIDENFRLTTEEAIDAGRRIKRVVERHNGQLLITNSPRISVEAWRALREEIEPVSCFIYDCRKAAITTNPLMAMLGQERLSAVFVTGDSISMCCEGMVPLKPLYILNTPSNQNRYYPLIHRELYDRGHAKPFEEIEERGLETDWVTSPPLDEAGRIAEHVMQFLTRERGILGRK